MRLLLALLPVTVLVFSGCGDGYDDPLANKPRSAAPEAVGVVTDPFNMGSPVKPKASDQKKPDKTDKPDKPAKSGADAPKPPKQGMVREKAEVGMGEKGTGYGGGIVTEPVRVYFRAQERIVFENQVPHALNLYTAMNGDPPKTHEEFMEKVIKANNIPLPELPVGHKYVYDPDEKTLMIEHPK